MYIKSTKDKIYDLSGRSVSLSSDGSIGAVGNDENGFDSRHVRVYDLSALLSSNEFVLSQFKLYLNPTKTQFTIQLNPSFQLEKVSIYNLLGQVALTSEKSLIKPLNYQVVLTLLRL